MNRMNSPGLLVNDADGARTHTATAQVPLDAEDAALVADAIQALKEMRAEAAALGLDKMTMEEIDEEIEAVRREQAAARS